MDCHAGTPVGLRNRLRMRHSVPMFSTLARKVQNYTGHPQIALSLLLACFALARPLSCGGQGSDTGAPAPTSEPPPPPPTAAPSAAAAEPSTPSPAAASPTPISDTTAASGMLQPSDAIVEAVVFPTLQGGASPKWWRAVELFHEGNWGGAHAARKGAGRHRRPPTSPGPFGGLRATVHG